MIIYFAAFINKWTTIFLPIFSKDKCKIEVMVGITTKVTLPLFNDGKLKTLCQENIDLRVLDRRKASNFRNLVVNFTKTHGTSRGRNDNPSSVHNGLLLGVFGT